MKKVLVTGAAGFIGYHLTETLLEMGIQVVGLDNLNDYYDLTLKEARLARIQEKAGFSFHKLELEDRDGINELVKSEKPDTVVNLAAQAGVRYSLENPHAYVDSNVVGFVNVLEACRHNEVGHLVYASSSSVYGSNQSMPFAEGDHTDHPLSLYGATKKANEMMAHSYSHLYGLPTTGLRFFTVYGPWGRPDMAMFLFTKAIYENRPIKVFNYGKMRRDFTYVDDIVQGIVRVSERVPQGDENWSGENPDPSSSKAPYRIYNIGNNNPVELMYLIECIEKYIGKTAEKDMLPLQAGDVLETYANIDALVRDADFQPATSIEVGVERFVNWYKEFYNLVG